MFKNYSNKSIVEKTKIYCGEQFDKSTLVVETLGSIDELGAFLALAARKAKSDENKEVLRNIQRYMFVAGSDISKTTNKKPKKKKKKISKI